MRLIAFALFFFIVQFSNAQTEHRADDYMDTIYDGVYATKSLALKFKSNNIILPNRQLRQKSQRTRYLVLSEHPITLFNKVKPVSTDDIAGKLEENSFVELLETHFQGIYRAPGEEWHVTYDVWHKIELNGEIFFTDFKLHDFFAFETKIEELEQTVLLIAQNTGYDYAYDLGYPEFFNFVVLNDHNNIIYESDNLDFKYGQEFWESDLSIKWERIGNSNYRITIFGLDYKTFKSIPYKFIWDGDTLK